MKKLVFSLLVISAFGQEKTDPKDLQIKQLQATIENLTQQINQLRSQLLNAQGSLVKDEQTLLRYTLCTEKNIIISKCRIDENLVVTEIKDDKKSESK
jgi:outer membrane murein-binding lipoprotein Lpp